MRSRSPVKTVTTSHSTTYDNDKDGIKERSEETYNRELTEKKTTILEDPIETGKKETYKKTTITEKEENIQKTEVLKFTQVDRITNEGNSEIDPLKLFEERRNQRRNERATSGTINNLKHNVDMDNQKTTYVTKTVKFGDGKQQKLSNFNSTSKHNKTVMDSPITGEDSTRIMGSPSKFGSCRDDRISPIKSNASPGCSVSSPSKIKSITSSSGEIFSSPTRSWSPVKDNIDYVFNTSVVEENEEDERKNQKDVEEKSDLNNDDEDWNIASAGNRRRRLKNLANKFHVYDEDEDERTNARLLANAAVSPSPDVLGRRNTSKVIDVERH